MKTEELKAGVIIICLSILAMGAIFLPGSQPGEGRTLEDPANCGCHRGYDAAVEPMYNWRGSMMSMSARDPIFFAALDLANHDLADAGTFCLRCHSPSAHQAGRTTPPDGSALTGIDVEGVSCDVCHALVDPLSAEGQALADPDVTSYGNAMWVLTEGQEKRGPYDDAEARHVWQYHDFQRSSEVCASCHDVSNPLLCDAGDPYNVQKCFTEQRTYSEWKNSSFSSMGEAGNCQSCHMPHVADGKACKQGSIRTFLPVHHQNGGNSWVPDAIALLFAGDNSIDFDALADGKDRAIALVQDASTLESFDKTDGGPGLISVRITNSTGHKLPTGYPEGRRMWINVIGYDAADQPAFESGAYNLATADLTLDSQAKVYEAHFGVEQGDGSCLPTFRLVQNNCLEKDNRIPPRGFTNAAFEAVGAGHEHYHYEDGQYWDDTPYALPPGVVRVDVNLYYQTTTREYIEFLAAADGSSVRGAELLSAFNSTNKAAPVLMESASLVIDSDLDGMGNAWETANGLDPGDSADAVQDLDGDSLSNLEEYLNGTDPNLADTDGDNLDDGQEVNHYFTDPLNPDTDDDGLTDGLEGNTLLTSPLEWDTDSGGEGDGSEYNMGRNPLDPDDDAEIAAYDAIWTAPRCVTGRGICLVTEDLILGRDTMAGGPEPNQPNTISLDPCPDGTTGDFHSDESIDRMIVTDLSGSTFFAGDTVEVTVALWCWTDVGYDQVNVYNGDSASGWTYLGGQACPGIGAQTLSVVGRLGDHVGDQYIRAVFSYESPPSVCDAGSYSDHDDVVIAVTGPASIDTDGDGLSDYDESTYYLTDPEDPDTDGDGAIDSAEILEGTDPLSPTDFLAFVPRLLNYQARLNEADGSPVNGALSMVFSIHESAGGSTVLWQEGSTVDVADGIFSVMLGGQSALPSDLFNGDDAWLEIEVEGEDMVPRKRAAAEGFSHNALRLGGQRIESGTKTVSAANQSNLTVNVVFSRLFNGAPRVAVGPSSLAAGGETFVIGGIYNLTSVGFTARLETKSGAPATGEISFSWIAMGE